MIVQEKTQAISRLQHRVKWRNNVRKPGGKTLWIGKDSGAGWADVFLKVYDSAEAEHAVHRSEVDGMQEASDSSRHESQPKNCKEWRIYRSEHVFLGATPIVRTSLKISNVSTLMGGGIKGQIDYSGEVRWASSASRRSRGNQLRSFAYASASGARNERNGKKRFWGDANPQSGVEMV